MKISTAEMCVLVREHYEQPRDAEYIGHALLANVAQILIDSDEISSTREKSVHYCNCLCDRRINTR